MRESYTPHEYYVPPAPPPADPQPALAPRRATEEEGAEGGSSLINRGVRFLLQGLAIGSGGWGEVNKEEKGNEEEEEEEEEAPISGTMNAADIAEYLSKHGCKNITDQLDFASVSRSPLSGGGFGDVHRGKLRDKTQVAIKVIRLYIGTSDDGQKPLKLAAREIHIWSKCQHPNVLSLTGLVEMSNHQIGMVSPWMGKGPLPVYLANNREVDRCKISAQICDGLSYLHGIGIVHGDLKGYNVLASDEGAPMLTDFGNAVLRECTLKFTGTAYKSGFSARWAAPELMDERESSCSVEADNYALGMTILEILTGEVPYATKGDHAIYPAIILRKEIPTRPGDHIPSDSEHGDMLWSLLTSCWAYEPSERPKSTDITRTMKMVTREGLIRRSQASTPGT